MRYLAVDLGDKRTGLAVGDDQTRLVSPVGVLETPRETQETRLIEAIHVAAQEHGAGAMVIGLPLNMDGTAGARAKLVRAFAARLRAHSRLPVHEQDERLTSDAAEERLKQSGRSRGQKKAIRDALAAVVILQDYLAARTRGPTASP